MTWRKIISGHPGELYRIVASPTERETIELCAILKPPSGPDGTIDDNSLAATYAATDKIVSALNSPNR